MGRANALSSLSYDPCLTWPAYATEYVPATVTKCRHSQSSTCVAVARYLKQTRHRISDSDLCSISSYSPVSDSANGVSWARHHEVRETEHYTKDRTPSMTSLARVPPRSLTPENFLLHCAPTPRTVRTTSFLRWYSGDRNSWCRWVKRRRHPQILGPAHVRTAVLRLYRCDISGGVSYTRKLGDLQPRRGRWPVLPQSPTPGHITESRGGYVLYFPALELFLYPSWDSPGSTLRVQVPSWRVTGRRPLD